jgi:hypothetical protein
LYHLLLDAGAFLLIYGSLKEEYRVIRISYVLACGAGSLVLSIWESPVVLVKGFCGLSGIAHGMMAVSALECMKRDKGVIWYLVFFVVIAKSIVELISGHVIFESLHLGMMGVPIGSAHAGGVLGGVIAFSIFHLFLKKDSGTFM